MSTTITTITRMSTIMTIAAITMTMMMTMTTTTTMSTAAIITTMRTSMTTIITTITTTARNAMIPTAAATITIITPTRYSPAGARETVKAYSEAELEHILTALDSGEYGAILRAKGIVAAADGGQWLHYDFVPEEHQVRRGPADYTGRICVIGSQLKEDKLSQLFGL